MTTTTTTTPSPTTSDAGAARAIAGDTRYLQRPEGRIAYDVTGDGPLVICVPGMGDLRGVYRFLAPGLVAAGYRVATMDLRGHGESDTGFGTYDTVAAGTDVVALARELGGPAVVIGNSMGAGAAAWAAAEAPDAIAGLVLIGPFVRNPPSGKGTALLFKLLLMRPWGPTAWNGWYRRLYPGTPPADLDAYRATLRRSLAQPGRWQAFRATTATSHAPVEARLAEVRAPTMVIMGEADPDFRDPRAEADWIADRLGGSVVMVPGAGHYPQAESPAVVTPAVLDLLERATGARVDGAQADA